MTRSFRSETPRDRIERSSIPVPFSGCWLWLLAIDSCGRGVIRVGGRSGKTVRASRFAYEAFRGSIPNGMVVRHRCDEPACVNPDHLLLGTQRDNIDDMRMRDRRPTELTRAEVIRARQAWNNGHSQRTIAQCLGVSQAAIQKAIRQKRTWEDQR